MLKKYFVRAVFQREQSVFDTDPQLHDNVYAWPFQW
jgi:hypothetical protein